MVFPVAPTEVAPQPLSFAPESASALPAASGGLIAALVMLAVMVALILWLRRRARRAGAGLSSPMRWSISQRLRLGPASTATFVHGDTGEWMIVESRNHLVVTQVAARGQDEPPA